MKKINRLTLVLTLMAAGLFAGCASDEEATRENQKIALDGSHFKFTEVAYQADQAVTRAAAPVKPTTVDLGDGLEAEVSVTPDAPTGKTRAVDPISDGKYTILAFDPTTHDLQGKLVGSVTSGVFTPDAGQKLLLDPGTYDFTCFSEPVVYDEPNNRLVVNNWQTKSPTIAHAQATIAGDVYEVQFNMEHKAARVRLNITSDILSENTPIDAYLQGTTFLTGYWMQDWYTAFSGALNNTGNFMYNTPQPLAFTNVAPVTTQAGTTCTSAYGYMLPSTAPNNSLRDYTLHFTAGTIGGGSLASKAINLSGATFPTGFQWDYNQSITINVNVKGQLYLFEDGKARVYAGRGTHTPIGLVIQQKWEPTNQKGTACALDILNYTWKNVDDHIEENISPSPTNMAEAAADMNGENWTYNANLQGTVRSNQATTYPAFYQAARYTPGVATASSIGRWYLPSYGELIKFVQVFQKGFTPTATEPVSPHIDQMNTGFLSKVQNAFTQASKPDMSGHFIISSTQVYGGTPSMGFRPVFINIGSGDQLYTGFCWNTMTNSYILPFVHF